MALLAIVTLVAFLPVLGNSFITVDDPLYVTRNEQIAGGLTPRALAWGMTTFHAGNWHPLTWYSHALDITLFGLNPSGHHAVSLLLHLANALLLLRLVLLAGGRRNVALVTALLFAIHPLRVESVAWVSERKDLLCAFFGLASLLVFRRYLRTRAAAPYVGSLGLYLFGLASKPMLVTLPLAMLLMDWWPYGRLRGQARGRLTRPLLEKVPFLLLAALSSVITLIAQTRGGWVRSLDGYTLAVRLQNAAAAYAAYLEKTFWPLGLAMPYTHAQGNLPPIEVAAGAFLVLALTLAAVGLGRKAPSITVGWLWFAGMLVPVIGLVQVADQSMADRYTYLPAIGLAWGLTETVLRAFPPRRTGAAALGILVLLLGIMTWRQTGVWRDDVTLFSHAVRVTRENWLAHQNLGSAFLRAGQYRQAEEIFNRMIAAGQVRAEILNNLGVASLARLPEAVARFENALRIDSTFSLAYRNLGETYQRMGDQERAGKAFALATRFMDRIPAGKDRRPSAHPQGAGRGPEGRR
jgi:tetratricopeptide (TPR) repeat protein